MKKSKLIVFVLLSVLLLGGCGAENRKTESAEAPASETEITAEISRDKKYNAAIVEISEEDFEKAGFQLGDSCNVTFSNGYELDDIPYFNGYYVVYADPLVVAYPGAEYISVTLNNRGIWDEAQLEEGETVTISLNEKEKYADVQETLGQAYSFSREDYESDTIFCNFRALSGGNMKPNFLFRGASPFDSSRGRAPYTDMLLKENGICFILDLADSKEDIENDMTQGSFHSPYAEEIYKKGNVASLALSAAFETEDFELKLADGLRQMMASPGPVYIHCTEGKDRTGFVCMLLEALCGASYDEMRADYMMTYSNYYGVTEAETPDKYEAICDLYFDSFVAFLHGTEDKEVLKTADYTADVAAYLKAGGMSDEEISQLTVYLTADK